MTRAEDEYGTFATITVGGVTQRLRWIPPGSFMMGSPPSEAARFEAYEGQHEVHIAGGFWLGETPVTQALWEAVMGENPSRFVDPERPVEQVSWDACQHFCWALHVPGMVARLPAEAEWEYACRAGTTTATWAGDLEILGANHAPALDAIAWYGGNSGHQLDLRDGHDSEAWPDPQYPHSRAGTRKVGLKRPNPWGLHDMLGNVWEWCQDAWSESHGHTAAEAPVGFPSERVTRGGAWCDRARFIRAACRCVYAANDELGFLGLRLVLQPAGGAPARIAAAAKPLP